MKKIKLFIITLCLVVLGVNCVLAANTNDVTFSFYNYDSTGYSYGGNKDNSSDTYIYPKTGNSIRYTVQGRNINSITDPYEDRSFSVRIPTGTKGSVENGIRQHNDNYARLKFTAINTVPVTTTGVWSPDCAGSYTRYGVGYNN